MSAIAVRPLNRTLLLACAPFLGLLLWLFLSNVSLELSEQAYPQLGAQSPASAGADGPALAGLDQARELASGTGQSIKKQITLYQKTNADMAKIASIASSQAGRPYQIYDSRITRKLGSPSATIRSDKLDAQLYYLGTQNFQSYAVKIKMKKQDAAKLVLGNDKIGGAETTLSAANRYKAAIGINAGGFADGGGKRYPLGTTVVGGSYVDGFQPTMKDLFFVGLNANNKLIGGKFSSQAQLDALGPKFGATFVPILMKGGQPTVIPDKWRTSPKRAPRTVIANYKDDQLLFLIANGYNENGSSGATLEEMQLLLQRYGAVDGYNLDGGGSTSLVFNGRVVNSPSDGTLRKLPTHFLFFK
ncbi:phosphodiester glycosidase family protein [Cohnella sp. REN36]|uniref:phosphodiester glycosidase family protein n=1 Tax=Cohnella sp. REN36 TaxID=2887347 RepID=UPI001D15953C|nr:phosphodiester glycosidase family protein [Cohnella sp. REN36]MCC3376207.1 phosphodiester glycosidase family protein [Cohnella sp. REN36]